MIIGMAIFMRPIWYFVSRLPTNFVCATKPNGLVNNFTIIFNYA